MELAARISGRQKPPGRNRGLASFAARAIPGTRRGVPFRLDVPAILFVTLLCVQGVATGATTVTAHAPARYAVAHVGKPPVPPVVLTATADAPATPGQAGLGAAGSQPAGLPGMAGTPTTLPPCLGAACRDRYIVANPAGLVGGDYAERATFTVTQPLAPPGVSTGFLVELVVHTSTGWIVGRAYVATGTTTRIGGSTITLVLYLNLGTVTAPTVLSVHTVVDECSLTTVCP